MRETVKPAVGQIEFVVRSMAKTTIDNEKYFGDLDAVVGDGDFGYSLARGFESVLADMDGFERSSGGSFLKKIALTITSKIGGTSGPLWGTALLRAAVVAGDKPSLTLSDAVAMLRAAAAGIGQRGESSLGDKTLLDALIPATDELEKTVGAEPELSCAQVLDRVVAVAGERAENTKTMVAKRGRASYTGERSIGSVDAGAVAVARIFADLRDAVRA
ncbi:MAG: dihydroxyacetone kinase subunit DhaL [Vulcanimicrobiaceae bacterium]